MGLREVVSARAEGLVIGESAVDCAVRGWVGDHIELPCCFGEALICGLKPVPFLTGADLEAS